MKEYRVSVRALVEFIVRSGDISESGGAASPEAMKKGTRIHTRIQKSMGPGYRAEVMLKDRVPLDGAELCIEGRADGIFTDSDLVWIDEIKGIYADVSRLAEPYAVHRAQALCYAYMYLSQNNLSRIGVQMTYVNLITEEVRRFTEGVEKDWLCAWYQQIVGEYGVWICLREGMRICRNESLKNLEFPFTYREGQRQIVRSAYIAINGSRQFFVQAPTGIGKTISAVFPAVRAVGEGYGETLVYLTAKTVTRLAALEAFRILKEKGMKSRVLVLTAKEKICLNESMQCNARSCPYAKGHYDRVNQAVLTLWQERELYDKETISQYALRFTVCPYEMALDLAPWVDAVICDYHYVFSPDGGLKRFFGENSSGRYIFLVDEAHNLVSRGREMFSASVCREDVMKARLLARGEDRTLARNLETLSKQLLVMKKELAGTGDHQDGGRVPDAYMELPGIGTKLSTALYACRAQFEKLLEEKHGSGLPDEMLEFYFELRRFLNIMELVDDHYMMYSRMNEEGKFCIHLFCVNPSKNLSEKLQKSRSSIFFSATFYPLPYYRGLLSTREDDYGLYAASPFRKENRKILIVSDVSTRYKRRVHSEYKKIAFCISSAVRARKGNYLVFFPSFGVLKDVRSVFEEEKDPDIRLICQDSDMSEKDREAFLEQFALPEAGESQSTLIGFAVLGGIFSEGIDLPGDRLIGVVVVGTGLDRISAQGQVLKAYYDRRGQDGFAYAYRIPGMNKVLQAAGRVIRTAQDRGIIVLMDDRFLADDYRGLFPPEWNDRQICRSKDIARLLEEFWNEDKN